jgi:hypothetical protein
MKIRVNKMYLKDVSYENVDRPPQDRQGEVCNGPSRTVKDREFHEYLCGIQLPK